jgi:hypothetical protein
MTMPLLPDDNRPMSMMTWNHAHNSVIGIADPE